MTDAFAEFWFSMALQCTLLLALVTWLTRREQSSLVRDGLWSSGYFLILLLWGIGFLFPHVRLVPDLGIVDSVPRQSSYGIVRYAIHLVGIIWGAGVVLLLSGLILSLLQAGRIVRSAQVWTCGLEDCESLLARFGVQLRVSPLVEIPFCWQFHKPVIVVPTSMMSYPAEQLSVILRHELGHLVAHHPFQLFLQRLVETLFWYHPLVWRCARLSAMQRELVADRWAVRNREEAAALLQGLLRLSDLPMDSTSRLPTGLGFAATGPLLQERVNALVTSCQTGQAPIRRKVWQRFLMATAAVVVAVLWLPVNPAASDRSLLSPWPRLSADALKGFGITVRDFEIDNHRFHGHDHRQSQTADLSGNGNG